jgi:hypothetical protein
MIRIGNLEPSFAKLGIELDAKNKVIYRGKNTKRSLESFIANAIVTKNEDIINHIRENSRLKIGINYNRVGFNYDNSFTDIFGYNILERFAQAVDNAADNVKVPLPYNLTPKMFAIWSGIAYSGDLSYANFMIAQESASMIRLAKEEADRILNNKLEIDVYIQANARLRTKLFKSIDIASLELLIDEYNNNNTKSPIQKREALSKYKALTKKDNTYKIGVDRFISSKDWTTLGLDKLMPHGRDIYTKGDLDNMFQKGLTYEELTIPDKMVYIANQINIVAKLKEADKIGSQFLTAGKLLNYDKNGLGKTMDSNNDALNLLGAYDYFNIEGVPLDEAIYPDVVKLLNEGYKIEVIYDMIKNKETVTLKSTESNDYTNILLNNKDAISSAYLQLLDVDRIMEQVTWTNTEDEICAANGLTKNNVTKGSEWSIISDLKGAPSHKQGGIDLKIKDNSVHFTKNNTTIKAEHGLIISKR